MRFPLLLATVLMVLTSAPVWAQDETAATAAPPAAPAAAAATAPAPAGQAPAFYNTGIRMGTSFCVGHSFDCDGLASNQATIIDAANECIASRFGVQDKIMASFSESGEFENCVLPSSPTVNNRGMREWAVCCVKKNGEQCDLECTRYIDQKPAQ